MQIKDRVQTIQTFAFGYKIKGRIIEHWGNTVVILDEDVETDDYRLEFKKSELELID